MADSRASTGKVQSGTSCATSPGSTQMARTCQKDIGINLKEFQLIVSRTIWCQNKMGYRPIELNKNPYF